MRQCGPRSITATTQDLALDLGPVPSRISRVNVFVTAADLSSKMEKIVWKQEYSVGVERLDRQHQRIISVINTLIEKPRVFGASGAIADVLAELNSYVSEHFLLEEQLLEENGYSALVEHSRKHTDYGKRIADFCMKTVEKDKNVCNPPICSRTWR